MLWKRRLACSFCRRPDSEVDKLVAGPRVYICDRCVAIAADIMSQAQVPPPRVRTGVLNRIAAAVRTLSGRTHFRTSVASSATL